MSCDCYCSVDISFLAMQWVGLECVIVVFPDYSHLRFDRFITKLAVSIQCTLLYQFANASNEHINTYSLFGGRCKQLYFSVGALL